MTERMTHYRVKVVFDVLAESEEAAEARVAEELSAQSLEYAFVDTYAEKEPS